MKKIVFSKTQKITLFVLFFLIAAVLISYINSLYARRPMTFTSDAAYSWPKKSVQMDEWTYVELVTGHNYYLYLPEKYRNDKDNEEARLPLIVAFHGSYEKGAAISRVGKRFISPDFQKKINSQGCAVLVPMSRMDFFSDPHSMSLLIQNVCLKNRCIDKSDIIAFGFSQGAKFAVELACAQPKLFKGVVSSSGFYEIKLFELLDVLDVNFYFALSKNDKGIYEQGVKTAKICSRWCKNSRYVEYENRYHFCAELSDRTGRGSETLEDWICGVADNMIK